MTGGAGIDDKEFMAIYHAIIGTGAVEPLVNALRRGDLPSILQKQLANSMDPEYEGWVIFERRPRDPRRPPEYYLRGLRDRRAAHYVHERARAGVKQEAAIAETGVPRSRIFRAMRLIVTPEDIVLAARRISRSLQAALARGFVVSSKKQSRDID